MACSSDSLPFNPACTLFVQATFRLYANLFSCRHALPHSSAAAHGLAVERSGCIVSGQGSAATRGQETGRCGASRPDRVQAMQGCGGRAGVRKAYTSPGRLSFTHGDGIQACSGAVHCRAMPAVAHGASVTRRPRREWTWNARLCLPSSPRRPGAVAEERSEGTGHQGRPMRTMSSQLRASARSGTHTRAPRSISGCTAKVWRAVGRQKTRHAHAPASKLYHEQSSHGPRGRTV
jgi:hypothetical protein